MDVLDKFEKQLLKLSLEEVVGYLDDFLKNNLICVGEAKLLLCRKLKDMGEKPKLDIRAVEIYGLSGVPGVPDQNGEAGVVHHQYFIEEDGITVFVEKQTQPAKQKEKDMCEESSNAVD